MKRVRRKRRNAISQRRALSQVKILYTNKTTKLQIFNKVHGTPLPKERKEQPERRNPIQPIPTQA
jgi:hypothetical protein